MSTKTDPVFDGCEVSERLRSGTIADLYRGRQLPLGRPVLIKALSSSMLPSSPFAATLEREARLLAELKHPNILEIYDFVRRDERMWLVLEWVDGVTLAELLERGRLEAVSATAIALDLGRALDHAQRRGVVHRDLQPRNVMVSRDGEVKLTSFSIASDERLPTAPELLDGSTTYRGLEYLSPEQILGEHADPRSDLFSLGVMLYEMLSGERPFSAPDEQARTQRIRHEQPPPLSRRAPGTPTTLERIIQRCLQKLPADRFHSAAELVAALEAVLDELGQDHRGAMAPVLSRMGVTAREPSAPTGLRRMVRRPATGMAGAIAGLALTLALAIAGGAALELGFSEQGASANSRRGARLELVPHTTAYLRVVVEPWAVVFVDGQKIDTTPIARPIPLEAGVHYVRLEHPDAPAELRTVQLAAGEILLLDVAMKVPNVAPPPRPPVQTPQASASTDVIPDSGP